MFVFKLPFVVVTESHEHLAEATTKYRWWFVTLRQTLYVHHTHSVTSRADKIVGLSPLEFRPLPNPPPSYSDPLSDDTLRRMFQTSNGPPDLQVQKLLRKDPSCVIGSRTKHVACGILSGVMSKTGLPKNYN